MTEEQITKTMEELEHRRNTTSMPLTEENRILNDLRQLKDRLTQVADYNQFQERVESWRKERNERFQKNREFQEQIEQLNTAIKKCALATALNCAAKDFVTVEVSVPEDRMGMVIGKTFAKVHQIEAECQVLLEVDNKANTVKITSTSAKTLLAKAAIENITLATSHSIGLHPDTVKVLMFQKSKNLQELEKSLQLKIDISKTDGILTTNASPAQAKALDKAIKDLVEGKVDIPLPTEIVPKLIGKKGETINQLMEDTGCLVDIDKISSSVRLCGTKESVAMAKKFVLELIDGQSQREKEFHVHDTNHFPDPEFAAFKFQFFAEFLMSNKGEQLKLLRTDASDARIKVLKKEKMIHVMGNKAQLKAMEEALRERLRVFEQHHWIYEVQDSHLLSLIIGKKGSKIKEIEKECADGNARVDIQDNHVCVLGDNSAAIAKAKELIMAIVDQNQRSFFLTSQYLVTILMTNKRAKLTEIEQASGCKLNVPPPPAAGANGARSNADDQIKIVLTGTSDAVSEAKRLLEEFDECHHIRYLPLDDDEIPTIIGKKGETIMELESKSGAKLRVLKENNVPSELEMIGTQEQLAAVQKSLDELLQTKNRQILQLDGFAAGCLIGKKGERIKTLRLAHPDAKVDAFPNRGQVRIKADSPESLQVCVDDVLKTLRETMVVESVRVPQQAAPTGPVGGPKSASSANVVNFTTILQRDEAIAMRLQELEAEGGENMKVSIQEDGKLAKIRGPAMGIGALKKFLEMLVASDSHYVETIKLPTFAFANVLLVKGEKNTGKLNENATRICKQTGCELRIKSVPSTGNGAVEEGIIRIEGTNASKVYEAKAAVENVLQFYFAESTHVLEDLPQTVVPRLYELLPTLASKYHVVFSLAGKTSLKVFTDSKKNTQAIVKELSKELQLWKKQHVEVSIPAWLVPILVGKSGETIKKLSADSNGAKLDLSVSSTGHKNEARILSISARDDATVKLALEKVNELITHHSNLTSTIKVTKSTLDIALSVRKESTGLQFHVVNGDKGELQVVIYGSDHDERERIVEKIEHLLETHVAETIALPASVPSTAARSIIGALIGKSGANIRALQTEFPGVTIDIRRDDNSISIKGPTDEVTQVKRIMEDKVQELAQSQELQQQQREEARRSNTRTNDDSEEADENTQPNELENALPQQPIGRPAGPPIGGTAGMGMGKLTKNQRRRMRKRAENEQQSDVLSMIMGSESTSKTETSTEESGYYHSTSGYSLRL